MSTGITNDDAFLRAVVVSSSLGVLTVDSAGVIVFSNGVLERRLGYGSGPMVDGHLEELCADRDPLERVQEAIEASRGAPTPVDIVLRNADDGTVQAVAVCEQKIFDGREYFTLRFRDRHRAADDPRADGMAGGDGGRSGASPTETERIAGDTAVGTLTGVAGELLGAEGAKSVAEVGLDAVGRVLGSSVGCIRRFDEETNSLERIATTDAAAELIDSRPAFDLDASLAGRAFRRGEPVVDRPMAESRSPDVDAVERPSLHVPLGEQGALTVFMPEGEALSPADVAVAEHLGSIVAVAFPGAGAATASDRTPETAGDDQSGRFRHPVNDVVTAVIRGDTKADIAENVCERLSATEQYTGAWFVDVDIDGEWRAIEASAGAGDRPPEAIRQPDAGSGNDTVRRAIEADEICFLRRSRTVNTPGQPDESGQHEQTDGTTETTVVVPLSHVDRTYGVLALQAASDRPLDSGVRHELRLIGDVVGLAIYATESKKLLLAEKVKELEFEVTDPSCMSVYVSQKAEAACEIEHATLTSDGDHLCYLRVDGAPPARARDVTASAESVTDCRVIEAGDDSCLLEVIKTESGAEAMMDVGATMRTATAEDGVGTLIVEAPVSADAREVVDAYTELNPDSRLVAKREIDRSVSTEGAFRENVDDLLTEKQQSVLTAAYYAGYFDWPRANTAEEVADSLGISPATLHEHLRTAERKILGLICED